MICGKLYVLDFNTKHQYQKDNPMKRRRIKRTRITETVKKGIAGLST